MQTSEPKIFRKLLCVRTEKGGEIFLFAILCERLLWTALIA